MDNTENMAACVTASTIDYERRIKKFGTMYECVRNQEFITAVNIGPNRYIPVPVDEPVVIVTPNGDRNVADIVTTYVDKDKNISGLTAAIREGVYTPYEGHTIIATGSGKMLYNVTESMVMSQAVQNFSYTPSALIKKTHKILLVSNNFITLSTPETNPAIVVAEFLCQAHHFVRPPEAPTRIGRLIIAEILVNYLQPPTSLDEHVLADSLIAKASGTGTDTSRLVELLYGMTDNAGGKPAKLSDVTKAFLSVDQKLQLDLERYKTLSISSAEIIGGELVIELSSSHASTWRTVYNEFAFIGNLVMLKKETNNVIS